MRQNASLVPIYQPSLYRVTSSLTFLVRKTWLHQIRYLYICKHIWWISQNCKIQHLCEHRMSLKVRYNPSIVNLMPVKHSFKATIFGLSLPIRRINILTKLSFKWRDFRISFCTVAINYARWISIDITTRLIYHVTIYYLGKGWISLYIR